MRFVRGVRNAIAQNADLTILNQDICQTHYAGGFDAEFFDTSRHDGDGDSRNEGTHVSRNMNSYRLVSTKRRPAESGPN